jgi:hypothetical protein
MHRLTDIIPDHSHYDYDYDYDYDDDYDDDYLYRTIFLFIFTAFALVTAGIVVDNLHIMYPLFPYSALASASASAASIESPLDKYLREADELIKSRQLKIVDTDTYRSNEININTWCMEYTPNGTFIMNYEPDEGVFGYYTDKKGASFAVLDAVCKKFCAKINRPGIYVDTVVEEKELKKRGTGSMPRTDMVNKHGYGNMAVFKKHQTLGKLIVKKMNSFLYKGTLREFNFLNKKRCVAETTNTTTPLSFADFKNKLRTNNL